MSETPYVETEIVLAVLNGDNQRAVRLVDEMLPNERRVLHKQLEFVLLIIEDKDAKENHNEAP